MKHTLMVTSLILAMAGFGFAQTPQPKPATQSPAPSTPATKTATATATAAMPTADQVIDKYVQALGGKAAIEKLTSRAAKGSFDMPAMNVSAPIESYNKAPNKTVFILEIPGFGSVGRGYDGTTGWSQNPQEGLREMSGAELAMMKRGAEFNREIRLKQLYPQMTVKGKEKVGEREAYLIEATPAGGAPEKMYFDTQTGLLIRYDFEAETPQGKFSTQSSFDDYKEVDGVKMPFTVRQSSSAGDFIIKFTEVKHNVPVDDAKFNKPAAR